MMYLTIFAAKIWIFLILFALVVPYVSSALTLNSIGNVLKIPIENSRAYINLMMREDHLTDDSMNLYVQWFFKYSMCPLLVNVYNPKKLGLFNATNMERDSFIITTALDDFSDVLKYFINRAGNFYMILTNENVNFNISVMNNTIRKIWSEQMVYKIYLLTDNGVFIYDPFDYNHAKGLYGKIIEYKGDTNLERLLFEDMRGYPLRTQIFKSVYSQPQLDPITKKLIRIDGVDWKIAKLLRDRLNFTMDLQEPNPNYFGERDENGTYNGAIAMIINNEFDICLTGFFVKNYMVPEMEFSVAVYDDQLCIYVPKARRVPASILPIFSVRYDLWFGFIFAAFVCIFIWWIIRRLNIWLRFELPSSEEHSIKLLQKSLRTQFIRICIDTWVLWVRVNILRYPPFYSERIFIASLCLVSVIFGAIFESSLATVYIHPMYYKDIITLKDLDESGLKVIYKYTSMADDLFFSDTSPLFASLNKKLTHLDNLNYDVILDIAENGGKAGVTRYTSLMSESLHYIISKRVWVVPECPKYYTISYVLPREAPWEEAINNLLLRFLSYGFINKYIAELQNEVDIKVMTKQMFEITTDGFKILTIQDLQLAFYVVLLGNIVAGILFISTRYTYSKKSQQIQIK